MNLVADALAAGLRPADLDDDDAVPADTILAADLAMIGVTAKLARIEKLAERQTAAAERAADANERQAAAFETLTSLLAGCIGIGTSACSGETTSDPWKMRDVLYLRTGEGRRNFGCDQTGDDSDAD